MCHISVLGKLRTVIEKLIFSQRFKNMIFLILFKLIEKIETNQLLISNAILNIQNQLVSQESFNVCINNPRFV